VDDPDAAAGLLAAWSPEPDAGDVAMAWWARQARAALAAARGDVDAAITHRWGLAAEADRQGQVMEALWTRLDLGASLGGVDRHAAAEVLHAAGRTAESRGAVTEQQVADQLLRGMGVRTWRRAPAAADGPGWAALTEREQQVSRLAASGASNPEIAAALFLSRKTIERHLSNSLAKLGLRNRVELAATFGSRPDESAG
jgi:DNA-binding NarL/FixJ family response regulator